ncbi:hypothetical protein D3C81_1499820 [compost metagenome]
MRIKGDGGGFATVHGDHIDHDVAQRNVVDRLEFAFDQHRATLRALDDTGEKRVVGAADGSAIGAEANDPLHAHQ